MNCTVLFFASLGVRGLLLYSAVAIRPRTLTQFLFLVRLEFDHFLCAESKDLDELIQKSVRKISIGPFLTTLWGFLIFGPHRAHLATM